MVLIFLLLSSQSLHSLHFNTVRCVNQPDWTPLLLRNSAVCKFRAFLAPWSPARHMDDNFINSPVIKKSIPSFYHRLVRDLFVLKYFSFGLCKRKLMTTNAINVKCLFFFFKQRKNIFLRLLTTMCAGDGDLASLRACLL